MSAVSSIWQSYNLGKIAGKQDKVENFGMWDVAGLLGMPVIVVVAGSIPSPPPSPIASWI
jgi:hypothetical protein